MSDHGDTVPAHFTVYRKPCRMYHWPCCKMASRRLQIPRRRQKWRTRLKEDWWEEIEWKDVRRLRGRPSDARRSMGACPPMRSFALAARLAISTTSLKACATAAQLSYHHDGLARALPPSSYQGICCRNCARARLRESSEIQKLFPRLFQMCSLMLCVTNKIL